jgi:hypothetical protein
MPISLQGSSVWVPIPEERVVKVPNQWYLTKVHKVLAEDRIVILENGVRTDLHFFFFSARSLTLSVILLQKEEIVSTRWVFRPSAELKDGSSDLTHMSELNPPSILYNLQVRSLEQDPLTSL